VSFFSVSQLKETEMLPGVRRRAVTLNRVMLTFFEFDPHAIVPEHKHPHEQISVVIEGAMEFQLGDQKRILKAGEGACIPPSVKHSARILDQPTTVYDSWSPPREDYR
jgi:quercetin dioxygenase-like cupin family protein